MTPRTPAAALASTAILACAMVSGCPSVADDDAPGDDDAAAAPPAVVIDGLFGGEPSRYGTQKKVATLGGDRRIAVLGEASAAEPYLHRLFATISADGGESWSPPTLLGGDEAGFVSWGALAARGGQVAAVYPAAYGSDPVRLYVRRGELDGEGIAWAAEELALADPAYAGALFPTIAFDGAGGLHVTARVETDYDAGCDVATEDCPQERREVLYLTDVGGSWGTRVISARWTSTVPELRIDLDGGAGGPTGRGRLVAVWHSEDRPEVAFGDAVAPVQLWTLDLDDGSEALQDVPGTWLGEGPGADVRTGLLPTAAVDAGGRTHLAWAHVDGAYEMRFWYAVRDTAGGWSTPEPIDPDGPPITGGAQLVVGPDDVPRLVATIRDGEGGAVVVLTRGDAGWSAAPVITSTDHGFNCTLMGSCP